MLANRHPRLHRARVFPSGDLVVASLRCSKPAPKEDAIENPPMGSSDVTNSHRIKQDRVRKGLSGITTYAKRMLRSGAAILSKTVPRKLTTFATVTSPAMTEEENAIVNGNWSELVRQLVQHITRDLVRAGIDPKITYAVEVQEKRYYDTGIVGLHLHLAFQGRKSLSSGYAIGTARIDLIWKRLLENLLGRPVDIKAANKLETPRKDLGKEIGKYISKGGKVVHDIVRAGLEHLLPSSWWGMETTLKKQVLASIIVLEGEAATYIWDNIDALPVKYKAIQLSEKYQSMLVAKVGWITDKSFIDQLSLLT